MLWLFQFFRIAHIKINAEYLLQSYINIQTTRLIENEFIKKIYNAIIYNSFPSSDGGDCEFLANCVHDCCGALLYLAHF